MKEWGLPKDEFVDNSNWSHQLYVREARRMIGAYVITEGDLLGAPKPCKSIGMGSYGIDSHNTQRYITAEGYVQNEGDVGVKVPRYQITYDAIVPKQDGWGRNPGDKDDLIARRVRDGEGEGALGFEGGLGVGGIAGEAYWAGRGRNYCVRG